MDFTKIPFEDIVKFGQKTMLDRPLFSVSWILGRFCNYKCSYCWPYANSQTPDYLDQTIYYNTVNEIERQAQINGFNELHWSFSGGEPTAWKNFIPICEWIYETLPRATLAVNTNLSRPLAWWEKHYHLFDDVVASFHVEFADKKKYEENSIFLCDKVNYLSTKMLMHEERFWEIVDYGNYLKTVMPNYFLEWTPLFDEMSANTGPWHYKDPAKEQWLKDHTTEMHQTKRKPTPRTTCTASYNRYDDNPTEVCNSNEVIVAGNNFFSGWNCNVGDCIFINPIGEMSLASCGVGGTAGHILTDIDNVGPKQVVCTKTHCHCGTDIIIPKIKQ